MLDAEAGKPMNAASVYPTNFGAAFCYELGWKVASQLTRQPEFDHDAGMKVIRTLPRARPVAKPRRYILKD